MKPVKRNRKPLLAIGIIFSTVLVLLIAIIVMYMVSAERAQEKYSEKECSRQHEESFRGTVLSIEKFEYNQHMNENYFGLNVKLNDTNLVNYMFENEKYEELASFVHPQDSLIKSAGTDSFLVVRSDGIARHFVLPECGED